MIEGVIDLENGGAMVMRKDSMMISGLNEQESFTFPSPMALRFQALHAACQFQRKYWIGSLIFFLLVIAGIVSALVIVASKDSMPETTSSTSSMTSPSTSEPGPKIYSKTWLQIRISILLYFKSILFVSKDIIPFS